MALGNGGTFQRSGTSLWRRERVISLSAATGFQNRGQFFWSDAKRTIAVSNEIAANVFPVADAATLIFFFTLQSRELKTVYIQSRGNFLKLLLDKPYMNPHNMFNQVRGQEWGRRGRRINGLSNLVAPCCFFSTI